MRTYLVDTCIFVIATGKGLDALAPAARKAVVDESNELVMSSLSAVEIAMLSAKGRARFTRDSMLAGLKALRIALLPFSNQHALRYFSLPDDPEHRDPFDRMLIAQALEDKLPVVTSDRRFRRYAGLEVIW